MNKTRLRKQQRNERMILIYRMEHTTDDNELAILTERLLDMTNRHRREREGRIMPKLTVSEYRGLVAQGLKDKDIAKRKEMSPQSLSHFKRTNGLINKSKPGEVKGMAVSDAVEVPVPIQEEKPVEVVVEPVQTVEAIPVLESKSTIKDQLISLFEQQLDSQNEKGMKSYGQTLDACPVEAYDWSQMLNEELIDALQYQQKEIARLKELNNASESEVVMQYKIEELERNEQLWRDRYKQKQNELFDFMGDYRKVEADFLNERYENKRLLGMLDKLKRTEQINVWLMEQHIGFVQQLDNVTEQKEAGDFVWR